jgi:16S rRNA (guanine527-N7)-methyltransferase
MIDYKANLIEQGLSYLNIPYTSETIEKFLIYLEEIEKYNERVNITGYKNYEEIIIKGFFDSLTCYYALNTNSKVVDIGTGAGFPGIPLKICFPSLILTAIESSHKKVYFLEKVISILKLDVEVLCARAEIISKKEEYKEKFDATLSKAVGKLKDLIKICTPFLKIKGKMIVQKSQKVEQEIKESEKIIKKYCLSINEIKEVRVPFLDAKRVIILIEKQY